MACAFSLNMSLLIDKNIKININIDEDFLEALNDFVNDVNDNNYIIINNSMHRGITLIKPEDIKIDTLTI